MATLHHPHLQYQHAAGSTIDMRHGAGGSATAQLIQRLFIAYFDNDWLRQGNDYAQLAPISGRLVMTTDSHVISPLFFPGGTIGSLAVHGTINDLAMSGAQPLYLTAAFILEEGLPLSDLERIVSTMSDAAHQAGVPVIAGDTKVVERGKADGCFITTTGLGVVPPTVEISGHRARPGDHILVSGTIGDHGLAILSQREHLGFETELISDTAALHHLVATLIATGADIHCLRDPTRGGVATILNELAQQSQVGMCLNEAALPIRAEVNAACDLLGLDPLYLANEGKLVAIVAPEHSATVLAAMHQHPLGLRAARIGEVVTDERCWVRLETLFGGQRLLDWLDGDPLPRIC
jgi:hydrogenase expression/formation protein HypE